MPRRKGTYKKRPEEKDLIYNNELVAKCINIVLKKGKKSLARKIVYKAFDLIREKTKKAPLEVFFQAIENTRPLLRVKPRRVGGATYQVPVEVPKELGQRLAIRWLITTARNQKGKPMYEKLANELINAYNNTGATVKRKEDLHKMAEANKAFIHYRW